MRARMFKLKTDVEPLLFICGLLNSGGGEDTTVKLYGGADKMGKSQYTRELISPQNM